MASRSDLMLRMVTEAGPSLLSAVALFSAFMFVSAVFFAVYVVIIYLTKTDIAEGWTTLSLSISGMLAFLGAALFAICVTLRKAMEIMRGRTIDYLVAERSSVDLFESVSNALNVDTDGTESLEDRREATPDSKLVHKQTAGGAP
jgi:F0F1-type ATP synthase assembly protein I